LCWSCSLEIYLVDGTYELFRHYYALPSAKDSDGREVAAVRGVLASVLGMMKGGATHIAVATDHVIESFGWDRVMFGSDWPVCNLSASCQRWVATLLSLTAGAGEANQKNLFHDNAIHIYRLD